MAKWMLRSSRSMTGSTRLFQHNTRSCVCRAERMRNTWLFCRFKDILVLQALSGGITFSDMDTGTDIAAKILCDELNITPTEITRFTTGYCHSVFYVRAEIGECVLRLTGEENKGFYLGSVKWMDALARLGIPVPQVLKHGQHGDMYYALITFILGRDLGEVYHALDDRQKHGIAKELSNIQAKVSSMPSINLYGYENNSFATWLEFIESHIKRSHGRITQNDVFGADVCDAVSGVMHTLRDYFADVKPTPFLDDTTTKNVLVHNGKLAGIVDVDEVCYGDSLLTVGLTNMSLLAMKADTKYIDYWLDELQANAAQRNAVTFYTLLFCIDFMGEQGMRFDNGNTVPVNPGNIESLNVIYHELLGKLS